MTTTRPVVHSSWPNSSTEFFGQSMAIPGNRTDSVYTPSRNSGTYITFSGGNSVPWFNVPDLSYGMISTPFNFNIANIGDGSGGTDYSSVVGDSSSALIDVNSNNQTPAIFTVGIDEEALGTFVDARNTVASKSWKKVTGDAGTCETLLPNQDLALSSVGYGTNDEYLKVEAAGSNSASAITIDFTRNLYESFSGDSGSAQTSSSKAETFQFVGGTGISTVMGTNKVTINSSITSVKSYSTIETDDGSTTAESENQTLKFTNNTINSVARSALVITGNVGADEVRFNVVPQGHVGFDAQLVKITSSGGWASGDPGGSDVGNTGPGNYAKYTVTAYTSDGIGSWSSDVGKDLFDFSLNSFVNPSGTNKYIIDSNSIDEFIDPTSQVSELAYKPFLVGDIILAQRIAANTYAVGLTSSVKAFCS